MTDYLMTPTGLGQLYTYLQKLSPDKPASFTLITKEVMPDADWNAYMTFLEDRPDVTIKDIFRDVGLIHLDCPPQLIMQLLEKPSLTRNLVAINDDRPEVRGGPAKPRLH